jgi:riboflavin kinase / FMN adenylyltransferase
MKIISLNKKIKKENVSVAIGVFDGFHIGHQKIISELKKETGAKGIITFYPSPRKDIEYIIPFSEKLKIFKNFKLDFVFIIRKKDKILNLSTESFIKKYLIKNNIKNIIVGSDFKIGKGRSTDVDKFKKVLSKYKIKLKKVELLNKENEKISSSKIRETIRNGKVAKIYKITGSYFKITGRVKKGFGIGKSLGFKTANIVPKKHNIIPKKGVYKTKTIFNNKKYSSLTYVGKSPSIMEKEKPLIETYIIDFNQKIYDKKLKIVFIERIRDEIKFKSKKDLIAAIKKDIDVYKK